MERADMTEVDVTTLTPEDVKMLLERASHDDAEACYTLSRYYAGGKNKNTNKSRKFRDKAVALDHPLALLTAASERLMSNNPHARKGAFPLLHRAAALGRPEAMSNLGTCYREGIGCEVDTERAREWYQKAADTGDTIGMHNLGVYFLERFEETGSSEDRDSMLRWLRQAAGLGLKMAQTEIYSFFQDHEDGCSPEEAGEAFRWCLAAAEQGDIIAMYDLALFYRKGFGVEKDLGKMAHWFQVSAEGGQAHSQFNLGVCYINGEGVEQDVETGISWLEKSAAQQDPMAIKALYTIYSTDQYGREDFKKSFYWANRSAEMGDTEAIQRLKIFHSMARENFPGHGVRWDIAKEAGESPMGSSYNFPHTVS